MKIIVYIKDNSVYTKLCKPAREPMILRPTPICSSEFNFKDNVFVAELSDFGDKRFGRVYDDACDFGFTVISKKTGRGAVFAIASDTRDDEGELQALNFVCVTPGLKNLKAVLFND